MDIAKNGAWLALGTVGALAVAAAVARRGSRYAMSEDGGPESHRIGTFRIHSNAMMHMPGMVQGAIHQYAFDPDWSLDFLEAVGLHPEPAEALASGFVKFTVEDDLGAPAAWSKKSVVVFTYWGGFSPLRPQLLRVTRSLSQAVSGGIWTNSFWDRRGSEDFQEYAQELLSDVQRVKSRDTKRFPDISRRLAALVTKIDRFTKDLDTNAYDYPRFARTLAAARSLVATSS
jgi:hypothetical protein